MNFKQWQLIFGFLLGMVFILFIVLAFPQPFLDLRLLIFGEEIATALNNTLN